MKLLVVTKGELDPMQLQVINTKTKEVIKEKGISHIAIENRIMLITTRELPEKLYVEIVQQVGEIH